MCENNRVEKKKEQCNILLTPLPPPPLITIILSYDGFSFEKIRRAKEPKEVFRSISYTRTHTNTHTNTHAQILFSLLILT